MGKAIVAGNFACARRLMASIEQLETIRDSAELDLATMPVHKAGTQWAEDREADLRFAEKGLGLLRATLATLTQSG